MRSLSSRKITRSRSFVSLETRDLVVRLPVRLLRSPISPSLPRPFSLSSSPSGGAAPTATIRYIHHPGSKSARHSSTLRKQLHALVFITTTTIFIILLSSGDPWLMLERALSRCVMTRWRCFHTLMLILVLLLLQKIRTFTEVLYLNIILRYVYLSVTILCYFIQLLRYII